MSNTTKQKTSDASSATDSRVGSSDSSASDLIDALDMMRDEFLRIIACPGCNAEIEDLANRAQLKLIQHVPVIVQRDRAEAAAMKLRVENRELRAALTAPSFRTIPVRQPRRTRRSDRQHSMQNTTQNDRQPDTQSGLSVTVGSAWHEVATAPADCQRVLGAYLGVHGPTLGFIAAKRFYPDNGSGSEPITHWMPIPSLPNSDSRTPRSISDRATD